jgi:dUTP pyrophosphatase
MTLPVEIQIKRLNHGAGLPAPAYASAGAAGMDICSAENLNLRVGRRVAVSTGFALAIPQGYEVQVRPRSGLAINHGVTCLNTPGTIDCDYRGEVKVILINHGDEDFFINKGDRIAQLVVAPAPQAILTEVDGLDDTARGSGGFGSTGI